MIDMSVWQGRVDAAEGALGRRWHQVIQPREPDTPPGTTVLIGFACDAGVAHNHGRVGAAEGPLAIRHALRNMPLHDCTLLADGGDVVCAGDALEAAQQDLVDVIGRELAAGRFPLVLGGGHEMAWGSFTGLASHLAGGKQAPRIGIVNFDAHFDLRRDTRGMIDEKAVDKIERYQQVLVQSHQAFTSRGSKVYEAELEIVREAAKDGALEKKYKEGIAIGVSMVVNCEPCQVYHINEALKSGAFQEAIKSGAVQEALKSGVLQEALKSGAVQEALKSGAFQEALKSGAMQEALKSGAFQEALRSGAFQQDAARER